MSKTFKITLFGIISGLIWSLIAILLRAYYPFNPGESISVVFLIGAATGIVVSFALKVPLMKLGKTGSIIFGILAFPLGTFIFGFIFTFFEMATGNFHLNGVIDNKFDLAMPFRMGYGEMMLSSFYSPYLLPLAILTTIVLKKVIRPENNLSLKH